MRSAVAMRKIEAGSTSIGHSNGREGSTVKEHEQRPSHGAGRADQHDRAQAKKKRQHVTGSRRHA